MAFSRSSSSSLFMEDAVMSTATAYHDRQEEKDARELADAMEKVSHILS